MQDVYTWIVVSIALGGAGFFISFSKALKERRDLLDSLPSNTAENILEDERSPREKLSGITFVLATVTCPAFIYTILGSMLVIIFGVDSDVQLKITAGGLIALGLSSFFTNIGRFRIFEEVMNGLNDWDEGSLKDTGKYMVFLVYFEPPAIYGLLVFVLGLIYSGILGEVDGLTIQAAELYFKGALIFGFSTASTILMSHMFNRVEGPLDEDVGLFQKKLIYMGIGHVPLVIGLAIALVMMIESGMM